MSYSVALPSVSNSTEFPVHRPHAFQATANFFLLQYSGKFLQVLVLFFFNMIVQNTLRIITYFFKFRVLNCCGRLRACAAGSARTFVRYTVTLASDSLARCMLIAIHWDQKDITPFRRLGKEPIKRHFCSKLALHLAPAASDRVCRV